MCSTCLAGVRFAVEGSPSTILQKVKSTFTPLTRRKIIDESFKGRTIIQTSFNYFKVNRIEKMEDNLTSVDLLSIQLTDPGWSPR